VLLTGGRPLSAPGDPVASAEVYDPATDTTQATGSMSAARQNHFAVTLRTGKVLVGGGPARTS
jgi:hypothetical protein